VRRPATALVALGLVCGLFVGCAHRSVVTAPRAADPIPLPARLDNPDQVIAALKDWERELKARGAPQASFFMAYVETNTTMRDYIRTGRFEDPSLMAGYLVDFARQGYESAEIHQKGGSPPEAWRVMLDPARSGDSTPAKCLLLGMNAHINHDLPLTMLKAGLDPRCECCLRDHLMIDEVLEEASPRMWRRLVDEYQPSLRPLMAIGGGLINRIAEDAFIRARENALQAAIALAECESDDQRRRVEQQIKDGSGRAARRILANRLGYHRSLLLIRSALNKVPNHPVEPRHCQRHR